MPNSQRKKATYHVFSDVLACSLGVEKAIILDHFYHATKWAEANGDITYYEDGETRYYTYGTKEAWKIKFPYIPVRSFYHWLNQLKNDGFLFQKKKLIKSPRLVNQTYWSINYDLIENIYDRYETRNKTKVVQFEIKAAEQIGLIEAILLGHIYYFLQHNASTEMHIYQDEQGIEKPWVQLGRKTLHAYFPFLSENQIKRAITNLKDKQKILVSKIPNKDRTSNENWGTYYTKNESFDRVK
ncbi:MAG: hypothetical protein LBC43_03605 [Bifidobacteriaceae bacterium]|jgi:hypothetical protein|nr:hypothetical protein [Bifidobacteriaceae bacterium]